MRNNSVTSHFSFVKKTMEIKRNEMEVCLTSHLPFVGLIEAYSDVWPKLNERFLIAFISFDMMLALVS